MTEMERIVFEAMLDFSEAQTIGEQRACVRSIAARLAAADALAEKADNLLKHINRGSAHGVACYDLDAALREYREASDG